MKTVPCAPVPVQRRGRGAPGDFDRIRKFDRNPSNICHVAPYDSDVAFSVSKLNGNATKLHTSNSHLGEVLTDANPCASTIEKVGGQYYGRDLELRPDSSLVAPGFREGISELANTHKDNSRSSAHDATRTGQSGARDPKRDPKNSNRVMWRLSTTWNVTLIHVWGTYLCSMDHLYFSTITEQPETLHR